MIHELFKLGMECWVWMILTYISLKCEDYELSFVLCMLYKNGIYDEACYGTKCRNVMCRYTFLSLFCYL